MRPSAVDSALSGLAASQAAFAASAQQIAAATTDDGDGVPKGDLVDGIVGSVTSSTQFRLDVKVLGMALDQERSLIDVLA